MEVVPDQVPDKVAESRTWSRHVEGFAVRRAPRMGPMGIVYFFGIYVAVPHPAFVWHVSTIKTR